MLCSCSPLVGSRPCIQARTLLRQVLATVFLRCLQNALLLCMLKIALW